MASEAVEGIYQVPLDIDDEPLSQPRRIPRGGNHQTQRPQSSQQRPPNSKRRRHRSSSSNNNRLSNDLGSPATAEDLWLLRGHGGGQPQLLRSSESMESSRPSYRSQSEENFLVNTQQLPPQHIYMEVPKRTSVEEDYDSDASTASEAGRVIEAAFPPPRPPRGGGCQQHPMISQC